MEYDESINDKKLERLYIIVYQTNNKNINK